MNRNKKNIPSVLGFNEQEAKKRLLAAGALVTCVGYTSKKGVPDADDIRVIRQRLLSGGEVELILSPCQIAIIDKGNANG